MPQPGIGLGAALRPIAPLLVTPLALPAPAILSLEGAVATPLPSLPVSNLRTPDLGETCRILLAAPETLLLVVAFDRPVAVNTLALLASNATAAHRVRWVGTDDPSYGTVRYESCPPDAMRPHWPQPDLGDWPTTLSLTWLERVETWRYWMAQITAVPPYYELGGLVVNRGYQPTIDVQDGHGIAWDDPSPVHTTVGNKEYLDKRPRKRRYSCGLKIPSEHEAYGEVFRLERLLGASEPVLMSIDPHPENPFLHDQTFVARMSDLSPMTNSHVTIYEKQLTFRELL